MYVPLTVRNETNDFFIAIYSKDGSRKQYKLIEIMLYIPQETTGIQNGDLIECEVTVKVFYDKAAVQISYGDHNTVFDYGTFSLKRNYDDHKIPAETAYKILIDDYMVNFGGNSRYHIDQF